VKGTPRLRACARNTFSGLRVAVHDRLPVRLAERVTELAEHLAQLFAPERAAPGDRCARDLRPRGAP